MRALVRGGFVISFTVDAFGCGRSAGGSGMSSVTAIVACWQAAAF